MKSMLTERLELRLTPRQKKAAIRISKKLHVSIAEVLRIGLCDFIIKQKGLKNDPTKQR